MTQTAPAMSGKSPSICCNPDSGEAVELPRIPTRHDPGSASLDQEAKHQEGRDPVWDSQKMTKTKHRSREAQ